MVHSAWRMAQRLIGHRSDIQRWKYYYRVQEIPGCTLKDKCSPTLIPHETYAPYPLRYAPFHLR